jgi:hypothetical protein
VADPWEWARFAGVVAATVVVFVVALDVAYRLKGKR